jgi:uncharacterized protein (UPF0147 family)
MKNDKPEYRVADALRKVAQSIDAALADGRRSWKIDAEDLLETLRSVADELDQPLPKPKRTKR